MLYRAAFATVLVLMAASVVWGQDPCARYRTSYDRTYCKSKLFVDSDRELNDVYKKLGRQLSESTRRQLVETQRDWIRYRDQRCESAPGTINVDCNYRVNVQRINYLRDRLRECTAGSCNRDAIVRPNW